MIYLKPTPTPNSPTRLTTDGNLPTLFTFGMLATADNGPVYNKKKPGAFCNHPEGNGRWYMALVEDVTMRHNNQKATAFSILRGLEYHYNTAPEAVYAAITRCEQLVPKIVQRDVVIEAPFAVIPQGEIFLWHGRSALRVEPERLMDMDGYTCIGCGATGAVYLNVLTEGGLQTHLCPHSRVMTAPHVKFNVIEV
jgi:hypothetical protein